MDKQAQLNAQTIKDKRTLPRSSITCKPKRMGRHPETADTASSPIHNEWRLTCTHAVSGAFSLSLSG